MKTKGVRTRSYVATWSDVIKDVPFKWKTGEVSNYVVDVNSDQAT